MRFVPTLFVLSGSLLAATARDIWLPGSAQRCVATPFRATSCPDKVNLAAENEIEFFIKSASILEVYPTKVESNRQIQVTGGIWMKEPRATGSAIRAEKIRLNGIGPNPEIELDINSVNVFEVYYNRSVSKVEFQARASILVGLSGQTSSRHSTVYAPFSPLVVAGQHSTLTLKAREGIIIEGSSTGAPTADCTGIAAGVLGLYQGKMSLCVDNVWAPIMPTTYTNHVPPTLANAPQNA